jgi:ferredoxin-NADP reductase/predicted pyridoxine 5'-phosphate oxidase superfamily flavin-nucleotide-binding protein
MSWENANRLATVEQIEETIGRANVMVLMKQIDRLDEGCVRVLNSSPIAGFGYRDGDGDQQSTYIGRVRVDPPNRFSFPWPDAVTGSVSFVFLLPGVGETLRVNGTVVGHAAGMLTVEVGEAYVHCARAIMRSRLWEEPAPVRKSTILPYGDGPLDQPGIRAFLAAAPFLVVSTAGGGEGAVSDTSPRGDQPGFVQVLDGSTVAIPERRGNKRADTLHNLLQDNRIGLAVLRPGRPEILRLHGTASITTDPDLLATMALRGMPPQAALIVEVAAATLARNEAVDALTAPFDQATAPNLTVPDLTVPDLTVLAAGHAAANRTGVAGGPPRFLLKPLAFLSRYLGGVFASVLGAEVRKEGYEPPQPWEMRVAKVRRETPGAVTLVLRDARTPRRPIHFAPGQFFTLITEVGGATVRRAYSASSAPGSSRLELTVKRVEGGTFSTHANRELRRGDRVTVRGPSGNLRAAPDDDELVMIAAGSGITPMMSIIRTLLAGGAETRIALLYGNRDRSGTLFARELTRLARRHPGRLHVTHRLSRPDGVSAPRRDRIRRGRIGVSARGRADIAAPGRIDAAAVEAWLDERGPSGTARYLLCGPERLTRTVREVLAARGVPDDRVQQESYTSATGAPGGASGPVAMTVEQDGNPVAEVLVEPGVTLLDAGLAAGAPMPYSCTVGNCGECVVKLRAGTVAMSEPNCLTPQQRAAGYVLTCAARPESPVTVDIADL